MAEYVRALNSVRLRLETYRHPSPSAVLEADSLDIINELKKTCEIFELKLSEQSRHMAWVSHVLWQITVIWKIW